MTAGEFAPTAAPGEHWVVDSATVQIEAPPERLYDLISDITKMGRWSPECYRCKWLGDVDSPKAGARFVGFNKQGWVRWATLCTVAVADAGAEFAFTVTPTGTTWRYLFGPGPGEATTVTETREVKGSTLITRLSGLVLRNHDQVLVEGMHQTLARLKAAAEQT